MKTPVTKQEWIDALTKAKGLALELYPNNGCIYRACEDTGLHWYINAIFDQGGEYSNFSRRWMINKSPSREEVAAVFDNSIQRIKEM